MSTEREKMVAGELYDPGDAELCAERARAQRFMKAYNATTVEDGERRRPLLEAHLGAVGARCSLRAPLYIDYGWNVFLEDGVFMNYACVLLDVCPIRIGAGTQIGPGVQLYAADHPRDPASRTSGLENGKPVTVGRDVWVGGGAVVLPGVTIGDGAIVGAGSVVTHDVAPGATVAGNPARALRRGGA